MKNSFLKFRAFPFICLLFSLTFNTSQAQKRPNIIIIMADDMGYSDPGSFGGEISTPNIDRLASTGIKFTNFYNWSRCTPSRASLLTGQYQHKVGLTNNGLDLAKNGVTIAEVLKESGYSTAMVGKWHLSETKALPNAAEHQIWQTHRSHPDTIYAKLDTYPINRGFQHYYGTIWGVIDYFDPFSLVEGEKSVQKVPQDFYLTDAYTDKAIEYLGNFKKENNPFFMYLAYNAPHWPLHARPEDIAKYKDRYNSGWEAIRKERYQRQISLGLIDGKKYPYVALESTTREWDQLPASEKMDFARRMATHAAMVDRVDQSIGKVLQELEKNGQIENTIIFFLSDNGASPETPGTPGFDRPSATRSGAPMIYTKTPLDIIGSETSYLGIGSGWANAANTPYRYWKATSYNGGAKTPAIVSGGYIRQMKGTTNDQMANVMDLMPTCLKLARAKYPKIYNGVSITSIDGKDLTPMFKGKKRKGYEDLYFSHAGSKAIIENNWKLVAVRGRDWALYNIKDDVTESDNIIQKYPDIAKKLETKWIDWAMEMKLTGNNLN